MCLAMAGPTLVLVIASARALFCFGDCADRKANPGDIIVIHYSGYISNRCLPPSYPVLTPLGDTAPFASPTGATHHHIQC